MTTESKRRKRKRRKMRSFLNTASIVILLTNLFLKTSMKMTLIVLWLFLAEDSEHSKKQVCKKKELQTRVLTPFRTKHMSTCSICPFKLNENLNKKKFLLARNRPSQNGKKCPLSSTPKCKMWATVEFQMSAQSKDFLLILTTLLLPQRNLSFRSQNKFLFRTQMRKKRNLRFLEESAETGLISSRQSEETTLTLIPGQALTTLPPRTPKSPL